MILYVCMQEGLLDPHRLVTHYKRVRIHSSPSTKVATTTTVPSTTTTTVPSTTTTTVPSTTTTTVPSTTTTVPSTTTTVPSTTTTTVPSTTTTVGLQSKAVVRANLHSTSITSPGSEFTHHHIILCYILYYRVVQSHGSLLSTHLDTKTSAVAERRSLSLTKIAMSPLTLLMMLASPITMATNTSQSLTSQSIPVITEDNM